MLMNYNFDMEQFRPYAAAYLVLKRGNEVLLLKRANTGYRDGWYSLVAGHLDGGETAGQCIAREAKEEAGIDLMSEDVKVAHVMHRLAPDREYFDIFLTADKWQGEITNIEPDKCDELCWVPVNELPDNIIPEVKQAIEDITKGIPYSEIGWN